MLNEVYKRLEALVHLAEAVILSGLGLDQESMNQKNCMWVFVCVSMCVFMCVFACVLACGFVCWCLFWPSRRWYACHRSRMVLAR